VRKRLISQTLSSPGEVSERQKKIVNQLLDGFEGKLTTVKWRKLAKISHDTALRDIQDMIAKGNLSMFRCEQGQLTCIGTCRSEIECLTPLKTCKTFGYSQLAWNSWPPRWS